MIVRRVAGFAFAFVALPFGTACTSMEGGAKETFSRDMTCPVASVEARVRADIRPSSCTSQPAPSKEIASDKDRLAMWKAERQKQNDARDHDSEMVEARGCGHAKLYACQRPARHLNRVWCISVDYPAGATRW